MKKINPTGLVYEDEGQSLKQRALSLIKKGETRHGVARSLGIPPSTVYRWAAGSPSVPSVQRAYKQANRAPCSVDACDGPLYAKGYCVLHYSRMREGKPIGDGTRLKREWGTGGLNAYGYLVVNRPSHPLATSQGKLLAHRGVLYDAIGEGPHPCHWCGKLLPWQGYSAAHCINVDHLDFDRLNNKRENLVPSCLDCNTKRGRK